MPEKEKERTWIMKEVGRKIGEALDQLKKIDSHLPATDRLSHSEALSSMGQAQGLLASLLILDGVVELKDAG